MVELKCVNCGRNLRLKKARPGATVHCRCGVASLVPDHVNEPDRYVLVDCSCGLRLKTTHQSIGKAVRCRCGKVIAVQDPSPADNPVARSETNDAASSNVENPLPSADTQQQFANADWVENVVVPRKARTKVWTSEVVADETLYEAESEIYGLDVRKQAQRALGQCQFLLSAIGLWLLAVHLLEFINVELELQRITESAATKPTVEEQAELRSSRYLCSGLGIVFGFLYFCLAGALPSFRRLIPLLVLTLTIVMFAFDLTVDPTEFFSGFLWRTLVAFGTMKVLWDGARFANVKPYG